MDDREYRKIKEDCNIRLLDSSSSLYRSICKTNMYSIPSLIHLLEFTIVISPCLFNNITLFIYDHSNQSSHLLINSTCILFIPFYKKMHHHYIRIVDLLLMNTSLSPLYVWISYS